MTHAVQQRTARRRTQSVAVAVVVTAAFWLAVSVLLAGRAFAAPGSGGHVTSLTLASGPVACAEWDVDGVCVTEASAVRAVATSGGPAAAGSVAGVTGSWTATYGNGALSYPVPGPAAHSVPAELPVDVPFGPRVDGVAEHLSRASVAVGLAAGAIVLLEVMRRRVAVDVPDGVERHHRSTRGASRRASRL